MDSDKFEEVYGMMKAFIVTLEPDAIREVRQIYTLWDALGDIGGLADMLQLIGWPIVAFANAIFGSGINRSLLQQLFKV